MASWELVTHTWPFSKSKFNLKSDHVNLVEPAIPIKCLLQLPNVRATQNNLGPERLTWLEIQMYYYVVRENIEQQSDK